MKLIDLNPRWCRSGGEGVYNSDGSPAPERNGIGITFDCPCGKKEIVDEFDYHQLTVLFNNPLDGMGKFDATSEGHYWTRTGDTFETLTLTPSIQRVDGCRWHGFITNGEIIMV